MKKGILMSIVAVVAAAAGIVITVMAVLKRTKKDTAKTEYDGAEYLDEDFDNADTAAFAEPEKKPETAPVAASDDAATEETDEQDDL